jgi:hypothetical protein
MCNLFFFAWVSCAGQQDITILSDIIQIIYIKVEINQQNLMEVIMPRRLKSPTKAELQITAEQTRTKTNTIKLNKLECTDGSKNAVASRLNLTKDNRSTRNPQKNTGGE